MINEMISESFLNISSPPFHTEIWQSPNLLNVLKINVAYIVTCINQPICV